ncbi:MAG: putative DNA binding domain-containing protein [Acidaminococcaceae bacterium]|nr:putative DNA binding domain-containing protein [Acidaminococcaceae bacterium]
MNLGTENERQEFKLGLGQLDKGLKSLAAMLNRNEEGTVFFGVDDDGNVKGLEIGKKTLLDIRNRIADLIEPKVICDIQELRDDTGRSYIRVHAQGSDIPYACDGRYYVRTVSADERVGTDLLRKMLASGKTDLLTQMSSENQSLSFAGMCEFLSERGIHAANTPEFLRNFGLFNKEGKYNLLAYLLSDQNELTIKIMRFAGKDKTVLDQRAEFRNQCLLLTVQRVLDYFNLINLSKKITLASGVREEIPLVEAEAFREAWVNACVHNTWSEQIPPSVYIYDDRFEIVSYGGLPFGLSEEGFFAGTSKPVNNRLFTIFITSDFSEQSGHGVPQIVKQYGKNAFAFRDGMLTVTLPFGYEPDYVKARLSREAMHNSLSENQKQVIAFLTHNQKATLKEVAEACEISLGGVKKIVAKLQEMNLLERRGAKNASLWIVK